MDVFEIEVPKTARYYLSEAPAAHHTHLCFCLHGYGQLAQYFITNFRHEELQHILFVAPEGLHRFYLPGDKKRVGATWMTKEARLTDITDYVRYLDLVYRDIKAKLEKDLPAGLFGFSQGVATACRWLAHTQIPFHYLVSWAGAFPHDLDFETTLEKTKSVPTIMAVGDSDEYISKEQLQEHLKTLDDRGFHPQLLRFTGSHKIYREPLLKLFTRML